MRTALHRYVLTSDVTPETVDGRGAAPFPHALPDYDPWAAPMHGPMGTPHPPHVSPTDYLAINGINVEDL